MGRVPQPEGTRGSLKWIQAAVNRHPQVIAAAIRDELPDAVSIEWRSPLLADDYAEYSDASFLDRLGLGPHSGALAEFWPARGPQWDALAVDKGRILLVEAKAHVAEMVSPGTQAGAASRERIEAALQKAAVALGATPMAPWPDVFYQLANRLTMLWFLRSIGVDARLVLVNFIGDREMGGPKTADEWRAAYAVAWRVLGLSTRHKLSRYVVHAYPDVAQLVQRRR